MRRGDRRRRWRGTGIVFYVSSRPMSEPERRRWREASIFNSAPDDKSYYNSSYGQHYHQNAHLLPGAPLRGEKGTKLFKQDKKKGFWDFFFFTQARWHFQLTHTHSMTQLLLLFSPLFRVQSSSLLSAPPTFESLSITSACPVTS